MSEKIINHTRATDAAGTVAHYLQDSGKRIRFTVFPGTLRDRDISELELSQRALNSLKRSGINTVDQLAEQINEISDLMQIRGAGKKTAEEVMYKLFLFQYTVLKPELKQEYLNEVLRMSYR